MKGTVVYVNRLRTYGFIVTDDGDTVFMHISQTFLHRMYRVGARVEFGIRSTRKGMEALEVRRVWK